MKRKPDDSVATEQLRHFYSCWLALEDAKASIADDSKELFGEAKGFGYDTKALRESFRRVRSADDNSVKEHEALVDLYIAALARDARDAREDNPSTAARKDVPSGGHMSAVSGASSAKRGAGTQAPPVDTMQSAPVGEVLDEASGGSIPPAPATPEPEVHGSWISKPEPVAQVIPIRKPVSEPKAEDRTKPHPDCLDPAECGLSSWDWFCSSCKKAAEAKRAGAA